ncbi:MAG: CHAT domain-containing protein, partial [Snowella sp.]
RQQKNYPLALQQFEQALTIAQQSGNCLVASNVHRYMSRTYEDVGDPTKSYEHGNQALTLAENLSDFQFKPASMANALNLMARAKTKAGDYSASLELSRRSQEMTRQANLQWANTSVYDVIANAYEASKQYDQAIETFQEKLALVRSLGQYSEEAYIFYFLAKMERQKGNLPTALKQIDSALEVIENIRQDLLSPDLRTRFFSTKQNYYELKINILMELHQQDSTKGYDAQAFNTSERSRARTLLELLNESNANIRQGVDPKVIEQENVIKDKVAALEKQWSELAGKNPTEKQREFFEQERKRLLAQYQAVQDSIRAKSPKYAALKYPQPLTLAQIQQQLLDPETALLQYSLDKEKSYLWVVTKDDFQAYTLPASKDLKTTAENLLKLIQFGKDYTEEITQLTNQLSQQILAPATAQLNKKRLIIVPDGVLNYLPFSVLTLNNQPLLSNHELINLPSSSSLALIRQDTQNRQPAPKALALLADPIFSSDDTRLKTPSQPVAPTNPDLSTFALNRAAKVAKNTRAVGENNVFARIPGTRQEANAILALLPKTETQAAFDDQANLPLATNPQLSQYRIIHLATHGIFNTQEPALSGSILSLVDQQGKPVNGFLRLNDIFNLNLPVELVVLSACETGLGEDIKG